MKSNWRNLIFSRTWGLPFGGEPPVLKQVLLVDDNDRYAAALRQDLVSRGADVLRVKSAREAVSQLHAGSERFDAIVTDITMETQISGLRVLSTARKTAFSGLLITASTGLDSRLGFIFNFLLLGKYYGCDYLIPKRPIKKEGRVIWVKT